MTVYDAGTKAGFCYMWHEGVSKHILNVESISHHFLEKGHTENDSDSMHSCSCTVT